MPVPPPVITAVLPAKSFMRSSLPHHRPPHAPFRYPYDEALVPRQFT
jgi:hypothetical protein